MLHKLKYIAAVVCIASISYGQSTSGWQIVTMQDGIDGIYTNNVKVGKAIEYAVLTWSSADLANKAIAAFGTDYNVEASGVTITNGTPNTLTAYNDHVVFDVSAVVATGVVIVAGSRVLEDDNTITNWSENVTITSTGCYQTVAKFLGSTTNSTTTASITTDVILTSYFDFQNQDFTVSNVRLSFKPSNPAWDVGLELFILDNDGDTVALLNGGFDFRSSDTIPRAANGVLGHAKQNINSRLILGSQNEGIIVKVVGGGDAVPANITEFDLTIGCELK